MTGGAMAQRMTITIPDEIYDELQSLQEQIDVAKICQEAIILEVSMIKAIQSEDLLGFLKGSKKQWQEGLSRELGFREARKCIEAKKVDYEAFIMISKIANEAYEENSYELLMGVTEENVSLSEAINEAIDFHEKEDRCFNADMFCLGFIEGIDKAWFKLRDKI